MAPPGPPRRRQPSSPGLPGVVLPPVDSNPPPAADEGEARWKELAATEGRMLAKLSDVRSAVREEIDGFRNDFSEFKDEVRKFMADSLKRDLDATNRIADVSSAVSTAVVAEKAPELRRHAMTGGAVSATVISGIVAGVLIWLSQTSGCAPQKAEHEGRAGQSQHEARR